ncbi:MAG: hypothetical protein HZC44_09705 [Geobacter sp.]|nr:hypothetical protein [Geobacter sp.]
MKKPTSDNRLCLSCRRPCKQASHAVITSCPRYYPGPRIKKCTWKQMEFKFPPLPHG